MTFLFMKPSPWGIVFLLVIMCMLITVISIVGETVQGGSSLIIGLPIKDLWIVWVFTTIGALIGSVYAFRRGSINVSYSCDIELVNPHTIFL